MTYQPLETAGEVSAPLSVQSAAASNAASNNAYVEVYFSPLCPYCHRAMALLDHKGIVFEEYNVLENTSLRSEMIARAKGRTSVPQVFINGEHIGGSDELHMLEQINVLDLKLSRHSEKFVEHAPRANTAESTWQFQATNIAAQ